MQAVLLFMLVVLDWSHYKAKICFSGEFPLFIIKYRYTHKVRFFSARKVYTACFFIFVKKMFASCMRTFCLLLSKVIFHCVQSIVARCAALVRPQTFNTVQVLTQSGVGAEEKQQFVISSAGYTLCISKGSSFSLPMGNLACCFPNTGKTNVVCPEEEKGGKQKICFLAAVKTLVCR